MTSALQLAGRVYPWATTFQWFPARDSGSVSTLTVTPKSVGSNVSRVRLAPMRWTSLTRSLEGVWPGGVVVVIHLNAQNHASSMTRSTTLGWLMCVLGRATSFRIDRLRP